MNNEKIFNEPDELAEILQKTIDAFGEEMTSKDQMPDPYTMKGMREAVEVFTETVAAGKKIKMICDSDADGLSTYSLFWNFFTLFPYQNIEIIITDRAKDGYGFQPCHVTDADLYITSDNGITSHDAVDAVNCSGAKAIICDHHQQDPKGLPLAYAIIDPYQDGCNFEPKEISGAVVLYFFLKALIDKYDIGVDAFKEFLPEVAISTISDVMPFTVPLNRFLVKTFLDDLNYTGTSHRQFINTFKDTIDGELTAENFSFGLIPSINASNRAGHADRGGMFMVENDPKISNQWFDYIKGLNDERKERQQLLETYVKKYFKDYIKAPFIIIPGHFKKDSAKGIMGLLSGNLARNNNKPCIVMNYNQNTKEYNGSGRSIGELDIIDILRKNPYVANVGGHKQALGITIKEENFNDFWVRLQEDIMKVPEEILNPEKEVMGFIPINKLNWDFFETLKQFEPYGHRFKKPVFRTRATIKAASLMGKQRNHLRCTITDDNNLIKFDGVKFFTEEVPEKGALYDVYFRIDKDDFKGGENIKLMVDEFVKISSKEEMDNRPPWEI